MHTIEIRRTSGTTWQITLDGHYIYRPNISGLLGLRRESAALLDMLGTDAEPVVPERLPEISGVEEEMNSEQLTAEAVAMADGLCRDARLGHGDAAELNSHLDDCRECRQWWADLIAAEEREREPALSGVEDVR